MIFEIVLNIIMSVVIIATGHYLWNYFRDNCTSKKTKDLVGAQTQKYKEMIAEIQNSTSATQPMEYISPEEKRQMVAELQALLI